jgi:4-hydroxy-tetrahydrodipicolinate reductase
MKVALIGFGAMGQLVASLANNDGHQIGFTANSRDATKTAEQLAANLKGHDVAIDFSVGNSVLRNAQACSLADVALVEGTTGWSADEQGVRQAISESDTALIYGANFSIGVNIFYRICEHAASLFGSIDSYSPFIEEAHHARKRDAPSGTAIRLRDLMGKKVLREIPVSSTRAGNIPGTHRVGFDSLADQIVLTHMARSREGFAAGALLAARWIIGRKGIYDFSEVIDDILRN